MLELKFLLYQGSQEQIQEGMKEKINLTQKIIFYETEKYEEYLLMDLSIKKFKLISGNLTSNPKKATEPKPGQDLMEECFPSLGQALLAVRKSTFRRYVDNKGKAHAIQIVNMKYLY